MTASAWHPLLDLPDPSAAWLDGLRQRLAAILETTSEVLLVPAEAVTALEAVAASVATDRLSAVNVVTSPFGVQFGHWLRRGSAHVLDVTARAGQPITVDAVASALDQVPSASLVALAHGEAATGVVNPLLPIVRLAHERGAIVVVDAVASVGAEPLRVGADELDIVVIGPQKGLGGPAGVSAITISPAGWAAVAPPRPGSLGLSLRDLREAAAGRVSVALPAFSALDLYALDAALQRATAEGIGALVGRHQQAARAARAGVQALGLDPWVSDPAAASGLVTSVTVPDGIRAGEVRQIALSRYGVPIRGGIGELEQSLVRVNHSGQSAAFSSVAASVAALGGAFAALGYPVEAGAGLAAVLACYDQACYDPVSAAGR
jgi:aspartate aminotransferase-like enzyme